MGILVRRPVVIANEIRLLRSQHKGAFLLVEGRDDRLFAQRFISQNNCKVIVAEGKRNLLGVSEILESNGFSGICGFIDSDFDNVECRKYPSGNIISTEYHDLEGTLLCSSALDVVLGEYGSADKINRFGDARKAILEAAYPMGCMRLYSERAGLNLRFEGL
jgi:hypothetical protein